MPQKIDLSNVKYSTDVLDSMHPDCIDRVPEHSDHKLSLEGMMLLRDIYPNKLLFTIKEVATVLNVSYEFVRMSISMGKIKAIDIASRKMISINELSNILENGVL